MRSFVLPLLFLRRGVECEVSFLYVVSHAVWRRLNVERYDTPTIWSESIRMRLASPSTRALLTHPRLCVLRRRTWKRSGSRTPTWTSHCRLTLTRRWARPWRWRPRRTRGKLGRACDGPMGRAERLGCCVVWGMVCAGCRVACLVRLAWGVRGGARRHTRRMPPAPAIHGRSLVKINAASTAHHSTPQHTTPRGADGADAHAVTHRRLSAQAQRHRTEPSPQRGAPGPARALRRGQRPRQQRRRRRRRRLL